MSPGLSILLICLVGVGLLWAMSRWMSGRASRTIGQPVADLLPSPPGGTPADVLLWFHSPSCGPCRAMEPSVHLLVEEGRARAIDVTEQPEVARAFGVMATPTTMRVKDGQIAQVRSGFLSPAALQALAE